MAVTVLVGVIAFTLLAYSVSFNFFPFASFDSVPVVINVSSAFAYIYIFYLLSSFSLHPCVRIRVSVLGGGRAVDGCVQSVSYSLFP